MIVKLCPLCFGACCLKGGLRLTRILLLDIKFAKWPSNSISVGLGKPGIIHEGVLVYLFTGCATENDARG